MPPVRPAAFGSSSVALGRAVDSARTVPRPVPRGGVFRRRSGASSGGRFVDDRTDDSVRSRSVESLTRWIVASRPDSVGVVDDVVRVDLEQAGGDPPRLLAHLSRALGDRVPADDRAPAPERPRPSRDPVGVALDDVDLPGRHAQFVGDDPGVRRPVALPVRVRARRDRHAPVGVNADDAALEPAARRLDVAGDADAAVAPVGGLAVRCVESRVPDGFERRVERGLVVAAVVRRARRRLVGERVRGEEVPAAEFDRVDPELPRREIDEPLGDVDRLRATRAAVRVDRRRGGEDARRLAVDGRDPVLAREQAAVVDGQDRPRAERVAAGIGGRPRPESPDPPVVVDCELGVRPVVAAVCAGEVVLRPGGGPPDRSIQLRRGPRGQGVARVVVALGPNPPPPSRPPRSERGRGGSARTRGTSSRGRRRRPCTRRPP